MKLQALYGKKKLSTMLVMRALNPGGWLSPSRFL
jgi:hypothetical protein